MKTTTDSATRTPGWKRALDLILIVTVAIPIFLVPFLAICLLVLVFSGRPIFFRQERIGLGERPFTCFKFRTMRVNAETRQHNDYFKNLMSSDQPMTKLDVQGDRRLIPGGKWLRATGLDELPQLINIFRGDMSMVGPRPCIRYEWEHYLPWQRERFKTTPGVTGLWQVNGKNRLSFERMIQYDIEYVRRRSLWLDLVILARTPFAILGQVWDTMSAKFTTSAPAAPGLEPKVSVGANSFHKAA